MSVDIILQRNCTKLLFKGADFTTPEDVKQIVSAIAAGRYNFSPEILQSTDFKKFVYDVVPWKSYWVFIGTDQNNTSMSQRLMALGIGEGIYWRESMMGNNAITTALLLHEPVSLQGYEHFNQYLHPFACFATPIFDSYSAVMGAVGLILLNENDTVSALALVHSTAQQISTKLHADMILAESNQHLSEVHALLDGVEEGVLAWDHKGTILYLNKNGSDLLNVKGEKLLGKNIQDTLILPQRIIHAIAENQDVYLFETAVEFQGTFIALAMSLKIVKGVANTPDRYIALLHPVVAH